MIMLISSTKPNILCTLANKIAELSNFTTILTNKTYVQGKTFTGQYIRIKTACLIVQKI